MINKITAADPLVHLSLLRNGYVGNGFPVLTAVDYILKMVLHRHRYLLRLVANNR